jgi:tRNA threonylcarbamoyladenosine biosynthesis protein TsaE
VIYFIIASWAVRGWGWLREEKLDRSCEQVDRGVRANIAAHLLMEFVTRTDDETRRVGEALGRRLGPGDLVSLRGPLGAGKTVLAQGIARGLGVTEVVNSPTFTLVQEYEGRQPVYHLDVYRLTGPEEGEDLALDEMLASGGVVMIEWPERIASLLPIDHLEIRLEPEVDRRRLIATSHGPHSEALLEALPLPDEGGA